MQYFYLVKKQNLKYLTSDLCNISEHYKQLEMKD